MLHLLDGLETAQAFGIARLDLPDDIERLIRVPMDDLAPAWISYNFV